MFAAAMGLLWLSTVPLDQRASWPQIFGVRYLSMLGGFVFLSHQVGSFLGVWLGGQPVRRDRQLRRRLVDRDRARRLRRARQPADPRAGDRCARRRLPAMTHAAARAVAWLGGRRAACWRRCSRAYLRPDLAVDLANQIWTCF